jgi:hypothetical protein
MRLNLLIPLLDKPKKEKEAAYPLILLSKVNGDFSAKIKGHILNPVMG